VEIGLWAKNKLAFLQRFLPFARGRHTIGSKLWPLMVRPSAALMALMAKPCTWVSAWPAQRRLLSPPPALMRQC
jgi:hypothetical protein